MNQSFDQSVGVFVDDLYQGRSHTSGATFLDVDRVEILKGPQSTFFGNNAIAGALNIVTRKPGDTFDASARALYGQDGQYALEGEAGGPVTSNLGVRAAAVFDGSSGWLDNVNTGQYQPKEQNVAGRLTFVFKPSDDLDATYKIEGSHNNNSSGLFGQVADCPPPAPFAAGGAGFCTTAIASGVPTGISNNVNAQSAGQNIRLDMFTNALTINLKRWGHTFTSVTGYYDYRYNLNQDGNSIPQTLLNVQAPERYGQFSQEFRVTSPSSQRLEYLAGVYFQTDDLNFSQNFNYSFLSPKVQAAKPFASLLPYLPLGVSTNFAQTERNYGVFGSATLHLTDALKVSAGLRGTLVDKDYNWNNFFGTATQAYGSIVPLPAALATLPNALGIGTAGVLAGNRADSAWLPSANITYQVTPAAMVYASFSEGFKAGGFNGADTTDIATNLPYAPEHVDAYEVGAKSKLFDGAVLLNIAVFRSNYNNLQVAVGQVSSSGSVTSVVENAATSISQGVEFGGQWVPAPGLRLSADASYIDAHYVSYPNAGVNSVQQLQGLKVQNLSGEPTPLTPKWSGSLSVSYTTEMFGYTVAGRVSEFLSSSFYLTAADDPLLLQPGYARTDAQLTFDVPNTNIAIDLIAKNLTDQTILVWGSPFATSLGSVVEQKEEPRNVAVQLRYHW